MGTKITGLPKTKNITLDLARQWANMEPVPMDRPFSETRRLVYHKLYMKGEMRPAEWVCAVCKETGTTYRTNGKHTSTVCAEILGGPDARKMPDAFAICSVYECDTLSDVSRLYSTFDSKMQSRSTRDINRSFAATVPALAEVGYDVICNVPTAIAYSKWQSDYSKKSTPQERAEALLDQQDFIKWVNGLLSGREVKHLKRMAVMAAIFSTWSKHPRVAEEFWFQVREESAPVNTHPTRKLSRFLLTHGSSKVGERAGGKHHRVPDREFFVKCLRAWNAYRTEENTDLRYSINDKIPEIK